MTLPIRPTPASFDQRSTFARHLAPLVGGASLDPESFARIVEVARGLVAAAP